LEEHIGRDFCDAETWPRNVYPKLDGLIEKAGTVIQGRGCDKHVQDNLIAAIKARINTLIRGRCGRILNVEKSTPFGLLFDNPVVVNLSQISEDHDKALIISLLLIALSEYRKSVYRNDIQQSRVPFLNSAWNELVMAKTGEKCVTERTLSDQSILAVAQGWHNQLTKWGVRVDLRARVRIDEEVCAQYHFKRDCELGDTAIPELPCWTLGEQVVEKGLADVIRK
jgi:hypothetical protein